MNTNPLVSIIFPIFNEGEYLRQACKSIQAQTYSNFEVIAVDDGSTDNSLAILKEVAQKDTRFRVFTHKKHLGMSGNNNFALKHASGRYIARMDGDDIMVKDRIKKQVQFLQANPDYVAVGGQVLLVDEKGSFLRIKTFPLNHDRIYKALYYQSSVQHATIMVDRAKLPKDFKWYDPDLKRAEDIDLFFRLFNYGKFGNLSRIVHIYRQNQGSASQRQIRQLFSDTIKVRKKAIQEYGYEPSFIGQILHWCQAVLGTLLPTKLIEPVFLRAIALIDSLFRFFKGQESRKVYIESLKTELETVGDYTKYLS